MLNQIGGLLFGLGLIVGFVGTLLFQVGALRLATTGDKNAVARQRYNRVLVATIALVGTGGVFMVISR